MIALLKVGLSEAKIDTLTHQEAEAWLTDYNELMGHKPPGGKKKYVKRKKGEK